MAEQRGSGEDRRRYFRVADQLLIGYRDIREGESLASPKITQDISVLSQLEHQVAEHLARVRLSSPAIADTLELFNRKINMALAIDEKALSSGQIVDKNKLDVNLSACGIAFPVAEKTRVGSKLLLDKTLLPNYINLSLQAQVVDVSPRDDLAGGDKFLLRADFIETSEVDQELLVQHVIKCQAQELKARREARDNQ